MPWHSTGWARPDLPYLSQTYPILIAGGQGKLTLHFTTGRARPDLPYTFSQLSQLTLPFFARVSPLVHTYAGGAGAPDLGGLLFRARVYMAVPGRRPAAGARRRGRGRTYPIFFQTYPILFQCA